MSKKDVDGHRAWKAVSEGDIGTLRRLLDAGVPVSWKNEDEMDRTLLHRAAELGRVHCVQILLEKKASVKACDEDDCTALHRAAKRGNKQSIEVLLEHGAEINGLDYAGNTALHHAAKRNARANVQALLMAGANKDLENKKGVTAFELCSDKGVRELILQFGEEEDGKEEAPKRRSCWVCGKLSTNRCTGCRVANYCSPECQKFHWKDHKEECLRLKKANSDARRVWSITSLDAESRELIEKSALPAELLEKPENLFPLLNILHFQTGRVFSTRHPLTGRKLITIPSSVQEELVLSFFSVEMESRLLAEEDPKMVFEVDKESRKRNVFSATVRGGPSGKEKRVAVKILQFKDPRQKVLYLREIRIVQENTGPNLMRFLSAHKAANKLWLATEWIDGGTLKEALVVRSFSEQEILYVTMEILQGLQVLHRRSVVHRDIKPSNVMLTRDGRVVIIDFGLCADIFEGTLTRMVGSPFFVAPEMVKREPYSFEVDIWSLGITILQLCNNRLPYDQDPLKTMFMYAVVGVQKPFDEPKKWSLPFQDIIINGMLPHIPKERATAEEMLQHPLFKKAAWKKPKDLEVLQRGLASLWPGSPAGEVASPEQEIEIDTGVTPAPTGASTGMLLDEDLPEFLPESLPSVDMNEVD